MNEDLDAILAEQYHTTKRSLKTVARLRRVLINEQQLADEVETRIHLRMQFFESMIKDKRLLKKKHKRKKHTGDILSKLDTRAVMKNVFAMYALSYRMVTYYWQSYVSFWSIGKEK